MYKPADKIARDMFGAKYASLFPSDTDNVVKPLRMTLGFPIIRNRFPYPDRELVEQITENTGNGQGLNNNFEFQRIAMEVRG